MAEVIRAEEFLSLSDRYPVIDVRTPSEFFQGHIPGAASIPLFDDGERKVVGTAYKQDSRQAAMYRGLELAGKKLAVLAGKGVEAAGGGNTLLIHCWRGGMRSSSMAWLFERMGLRCYLLEGGYRNYRRLMRSFFSKPWNLEVIGGCTGSGKTEILHHLAGRGEQVIDLEQLANHKGSAFGALGEEPQPTTEHFENLIGMQLLQMDPRREIWIEDESMNIGKCVLPAGLYQQMKEGTLWFLDIPREERARYLTRHYAGHDREELKQCVAKIEKRLGGSRTREAIEAIDQGDFLRTALIALQYYDKSYLHSLRRNHLRYQLIASGRVDPEKNALLLQKYAGKEKE